MAMTPEKQAKKLMEIIIEKGFKEMALQMNEEELELLIKSLTPEPNIQPSKIIHNHLKYAVCSWLLVLWSWFW